MPAVRALQTVCPTCSCRAQDPGVNICSQPIFAQDTPLAHPYIQNTVLSIAILPLSVCAFQTESLSVLVLHVCCAIVAYNTDPTGMRADLHWLCAGANTTKTLFPCPPCAEFSVQTSWCVGKLGAFDFSGAVAGDEKAAACVVFRHLHLVRQDCSDVWVGCGADGG
ncbi:hypothetical protein DFH08DRAFT_979413 [Mycena albidolilacea]|uniref:Uncharacterized protein n=1 Tax=Mycena albidolilacea TaxID=1033008 RepID=A0AAD7E6K9_9AGAR|nr:hypothetical protein DFH08DRAFT_979413 [Mycena albidolilacea]